MVIPGISQWTIDYIPNYGKYVLPSVDLNHWLKCLSNVCKLTNAKKCFGARILYEPQLFLRFQLKKCG